MIFSVLQNFYVIVALGAVALIGFFLLFHFTFFAHHKLKKQVREINKRFEYYHALLSGQDYQFVKRLEVISRTNLLYVDIHMDFNKKFKDLKENEDSAAQVAINHAKDLLREHQYKQLKTDLPEIKNVLSNFENLTENFNNDLINVIKPEEDTRQAALIVKEKIRSFKQDYSSKQADLSLLNESFDTVFANIEKCFVTFEKFVESAQYDEANGLLKEIDQVVDQLIKIMPVLPSLCTKVISIVPEKILSLKEKYEELLESKLPISHLQVKACIDDFNNEVEEIKNKLKEFDLNGVNEKLDGICGKIVDLFESFAREEEAKQIFDRDCASIYSVDTTIEKKYIKLCNALPEIKKVFYISEVQEANIIKIRDQINRTGVTKRTLDTFIHSGTLQPYTVLVTKMNALRTETDESSRLLDEFDKYLYSLKNDAENAAEKINSIYQEVKQRELTLRDTLIKPTIAKYETRLRDFFDLIDNCYSSLNSTPIDIQKINGLVEEFSAKSVDLISEIDDEIKFKEKAEKAILYANRDRIHLGDLHQILVQTETLYFSGDFKTSLEETNRVLQSIKSGEK